MVVKVDTVEYIKFNVNKTTKVLKKRDLKVIIY